MSDPAPTTRTGGEHGGRGGIGVSARIEQAERRRRKVARASSGLRTPKRRALWALALLSTGVLVARDLLPHVDSSLESATLLLVGTMLASLGLVARGRPARIALAFAVLCAGAGWYVLRVVERPADDLSRILGDRPILIAVEGMVETSPRVMGTQRGAMARFARNNRRVARFDLRVTRVIDADGTPNPASGRLYVRVDGPIATPGADDDSFAQSLPQAGAWVRLTGLATGVRAPTNPGEFDFRPIAAARAIAGSIRCASAPLVKPIEPPDSPVERARSAWVSWKDRMRTTATRVLHDSIGEEQSQRETLLGALLLGSRSGQYDALAAPFVRLGVSHVLAISGLHVAIFAGFVALLVRLTGDRWRAEILAVLLAIALMAVLIPARAPVVRAWAIIGGFAIAGLLGRRYDSLSTLAWTACVVLLWRPTELWNPGFQLSFLIVAALIVLTRRVRERLFGLKTDPDHRSTWKRLRYRAEDVLCASACAWIVSLPLVMHHFGVVPLLAPIVSLIILPLVGVLLVVGYAAVIAAWFAPHAADLLGPLLSWTSARLLGAVAGIDAIPGTTFRVPELGWLWAALATVAIWLVLFHGLGRTRPRRAATLGVIACLAAWPAVLIGGRPGSPGPGEAPALSWHTLDVGDGSAHILTSDAHSIMFDCGSNWYGIGERTIPDAARALGAWRIPTVVISHPDLDHYSGLLDSVEPLGIRHVLIGKAFADEATRVPRGPSAFLLDQLRRRGVSVRVVGAGDEIRFGRARLEFISPREDFQWDKDNDSSLVALVHIPTPRVHDSPKHESRTHESLLLLSADIERDAMDEVETALADTGIGRVDAMAAPHHGSARPFAFDFVDSLSPRLVVQSTGPSRLDDERWDTVKADVPHWLITTRDGAVSTTFLPDGSIATRTWKRD